MSATEDIGPEQGGDDIVAAEYVLGVLPAEERREASRRIDTEQAFARAVDRWEVHFAPMADAYAPVEAPAAVKVAVDRRLFSGQAPRQAAAPGLWASLAFWRGLAVAAVALFAVYVAVPLLNPPVSTPDLRLVASLAPQDSDVHYFVVYDSRTKEVGLSHVTGARAEGRDFELWVIEGNQAPASLGVIPSGANVHLAVSQVLAGKLASGAVLAISMEPAGGSPTGQPTGPVVAAGDLKTI